MIRSFAAYTHRPKSLSIRFSSHLDLIISFMHRIDESPIWMITIGLLSASYIFAFPRPFL